MLNFVWIIFEMMGWVGMFNVEMGLGGRKRKMGWKWGGSGVEGV